jgi:RNA polymerase sigma-70 factor (sigma-E family)
VSEDIVQEAFAHAWRSWDRIRSRDAAVAYLRSTVANMARMSFRRRLLELRHRLEDWRPVTHGDAAEQRVDLQRAVARLPIRKRACVVLRYYLDLTEEETARVLGVSVGTVKSQTHKALQQLGGQLGAAEPSPGPARRWGRVPD